ncbi:MAG TPA: RNA polymerase sigma factor, partial [Polyangiaceae bacterium]
VKAVSSKGRHLSAVPSESSISSSTSADRDRELVNAVIAGDTRASAAFYDRLKPVIERTLGRLLGSRDPAYEDLFQQTLVALVESIDRFRNECPLEAWASIVAARIVYRHIRRRRLERRLFVVSDVEGEILPRAAPAAPALRSAIRRVEAHLREVSEERSWTFLLHDVMGFGLAEVASITGASESAAQSRLVRGRKEIHSRIAQDAELVSLFEDLGWSREGEQ